jgi:molybdenum cofactor cytidylyltransferase
MSTAAVILAAGLSSRMGAPNKLLMEIGGRPVLRGVVDAVMEVVDTRPLVVLGHEANTVAKALSGLPVDTITNPDPAQGQASSVRLGLEHAPEADDTLVCLGDQPFLTAGDLRALLAAHEANGGRRITVPVKGEARGNPIVMPAALRQHILTSGAKAGCGSFTRQNPDLTHPFHTDARGFFFDIDTPEDLARAQELAAEMST